MVETSFLENGLMELAPVRTPEGMEKDDIKKFLDSLDGCWYFSPLMAGYGKSGVSDIIGCYQGRFFSIEVKREGSGPTVIQTRRMIEVKNAGGIPLAGTAAVVVPAFKAVFCV